MDTRTFSAQEIKRVVISDSNADLEVVVWDQPSIHVDGDEHTHWKLDGDGLLLSVHDDLSIQAPHGTRLVIENHSGDVSIQGLANVSISSLQGDLEVHDCSESLRLADISGNVELEDINNLQLMGTMGGDLELKNSDICQIERVDGDLSVESIRDASIQFVAGDTSVRRVAEQLRIGQVSGDLDLNDSATAEVQIENISGDSTIKKVRSLQIGNVGGDLEAETVSESVRIGNIGGDLSATGLGDILSLGNVGGDCELRGRFGASTNADIRIGGDARIHFSSDTDLTFQAMVGGEVSGQRVVSGRNGSFTAVYGEGRGKMSLFVGGDLALRGGAPHSSSSAERSSEAQNNFEQFGEEFGRMGEEFGRIGEEFGRHGEKFGEDFGRRMEHWGEDFGRRMERWGVEFGERMAKLGQELAAQEFPEVQRDREGRPIRVRVGNREWRMDQERLAELRERARKAADEGVSGAFEAVERALAGIVSPTPPMPPMPPMPPTPFAATGQTVKIPIDVQADTAPQHAPAKASHNDVSAQPQAQDAPQQGSLEAQRAAILRMIAEGRISPEEGDLLLEALG